MKITAEQVKKVAQLARLEITEEAVGPLAEQLAAILAYVEKLNQVNTGSVEPTAHAVELNNAFRTDGVHRHMETEKALANAPSRDEECFLVPAVMAR